jgi:hypothetical protein
MNFKGSFIWEYYGPYYGRTEGKFIHTVDHLRDCVVVSYNFDTINELVQWLTTSNRLYTFETNKNYKILKIVLDRT